MRPIEFLIETGVYADDLDQAEWFYGNVLGLPIVTKEAGRHVFFRVGEQSVLLIFHPDATLVGDHLPSHGCLGPGHFALGINPDELDSWRAHLVQNNIAIEHEESWPRGGHSLYFRDPAGNLVELITPGIWGLPVGVVSAKACSQGDEGVRVLMTGGYGCIGSWVARQLIDRGHETWIFDLQEDTHRLDLVIDPQDRAKIRFIAGDVSDPEAVHLAVTRSGATHLLHLAGLQTPTCRANPILGAKVNVIGTLAVFEAARVLKDQVRRVVYASSAAVHGPRPEEHTQALGDEVRLAPLSHYGAYKVCNELNARVYWLDHGITSVGLRPWTVYGVGRDFGMTSEPTKAIKSAAVGRPYHITYGGLQDLQYVGDVAATFIRALEHPFEGAEAFNLRGAVEPIEAFVTALCDVVPESRELITHGDRQLPIAFDLDDSRLQARLGPISRTSLRQGIAETYRRFVALREQGRLDLSDLA